MLVEIYYNVCCVQNKQSYKLIVKYLNCTPCNFITNWVIGGDYPNLVERELTVDNTGYINLFSN